MFCTQCGTSRPDGMSVCPNCGTGAGAFAAPEISAAIGTLPPVAPSPAPGQIQFHCPYCSSSLPPLRRTKVSSAGWILFWVLLFFTCALFCWVGLLVREEYTVCASCGIKLG